MRAILFAAMASGASRIENYLHSADTHAMIRAARLLGASVLIEENALTIHGTDGRVLLNGAVLDCGNSGQVFRFAGALASLGSSPLSLTGDASIQNSRPIKPLISGLRQLGASVSHPPLTILGPLTGRRAVLDGQDSQPVSGLLMAAAFAPHPIEVSVENPGETPWVDLTLSWLKKFSIPYTAQDHRYYRLEGGAKIAPFHYQVSGDFSSAAFPIATALLSGSELTVSHLDMSDPQGDKKLIFLLQEMGAKISFNADSVHVHPGGELRGMKIDVNDIIDALPILAVIGCFAKGTTELVNGCIARKKESDRIACMASELRKMGARIEEREDGLLIHPSKLHDAESSFHGDHRIAMSLAVAKYCAFGKICSWKDPRLEKSYPGFSEMLKRL